MIKVRIPAGFVFLFLTVLTSFTSGQTDTTGMIRYSADFRFRNGVYLNFMQWKSNKPGIPDFKEEKTNTFGAQDEIELYYACGDSTGQNKSCIVRSCFGFVKDGSLYISQGYHGYYWRAYIIGALTHYLAFTTYYNDMPAYVSSDPNGFIGTANDYREYLLDFDSGNSFQFTYKNFSNFLKTKDSELYSQLINSKRKKQMIHHFLLEYNKRHPIYFPERLGN